MNSYNFEEIFDTYEKPVYNYVLRMVRNKQSAEDLTQDIFIKIYKNLSSFREEAKLSTWIYRIATNTYLDYFRTAAHQKEVRSDYLNGDENLSMEEIEKVLSIDEQLVKTEMNACVQDYVNNLPEDYKVVIILHDLEGLKNREIADILGSSLDLVKIRLHRARKKFRTVCAANCNLYRDSNNVLCCEKKENNIQ
jgi:RNA polymerase sigma-70 factor (ECF subfamily)